MQNPQRLTALLTYCGALPFYLAQLPVLDEATRLSAFLSYGAVIASFMAGTLWGLVQAREKPPLSAIAISNGFALAAWASLLMPAGRLALAVQAISFIGLLATDRSLLSRALEKSWYFALRLRVTLLVLAAYGLALLTFA
ncbi:DUF3429 domain-containing protein [Rhizobium sp. SGZ-381]|uniref:DUF3429 domain-containing protein n=1 Tax=Rhizobium sp. SGZ-381 TaxID=3342800 RepID=UPI00366CC89A